MSCFTEHHFALQTVFTNHNCNALALSSCLSDRYVPLGLKLAASMPIAHFFYKLHKWLQYPLSSHCIALLIRHVLCSFWHWSMCRPMEDLDVLHGIASTQCETCLPHAITSVHPSSTFAGACTGWPAALPLDFCFQEILCSNIGISVRYCHAPCIVSFSNCMLGHCCRVKTDFMKSSSLMAFALFLPAAAVHTCSLPFPRAVCWHPVTHLVTKLIELVCKLNNKVTKSSLRCMAEYGKECFGDSAGTV